MKKKFLLLLLLLFALYGVVVVIPDWISDKTDVSATEIASEPEQMTETMEEKEFPYETVPSEIGPGQDENEDESEKHHPGDLVDREKTPADLIFASDVHYMSPSLTDYGKAFEELIDNGDGKVVRYLPQIWQAFAEKVIEAKPDALILSGDLTLNGEEVNHREFAAKLAEIEAAGVPVLVIPGNHDINNPYATSYFGEEQSFVKNITVDEFQEIYGAFGYDEAESHAPDSLSYLYILNDTTWLMMLDSAIYDPDNEVDGEIREETYEWMEQCLKEAYSQGITVIPVAHHNLQEISSVYVEECVLRNHDEVLELLETYLTPVYFSGHLHVQRIRKHITEPGIPAEVYGIWEVVSNSLLIPPCQYGKLSLNADGTMSYHTENTDISAWAARHGETNEDLLDFDNFSSEYIRSVISRQAYAKIDSIPDEFKEIMADFYAELYQDYYSGGHIDYSEAKKSEGYQLWDRFGNPSTQFRQIEGMMRDGMAANNNAEIPNPIHQMRE